MDKTAAFCWSVTTRFITTLADQRQLPTLIRGESLAGHVAPRIAMVGRSNVGKSSLLNKLTGEKSARVSSTPGRTRAIHFFDWPEGKSILVDLPGYGFAKRSHDEREEWGKLIQAYIQADRNLKRVLLLLDSKAGPTDLDLDALQFLMDQKINVLLVFTKFDQLKNQSQRALRKRDALAQLSSFLGTKDFSPLWVSVRDPKSLAALKKEIVHG